MYNFLKDEFGAPDDCWTSKLRDRFTQKPFVNNDNEYSAFTVYDAQTSSRITAWLLKNESETVDGLRGNYLVYHFDVKTTMGDSNESFEMSNNEFTLVCIPATCLKVVLVLIPQITGNGVV